MICSGKNSMSVGFETQMSVNPQYDALLLDHHSLLTTFCIFYAIMFVFLLKLIFL